MTQERLNEIRERLENKYVCMHSTDKSIERELVNYVNELKQRLHSFSDIQEREMLLMEKVVSLEAQLAQSQKELSDTDAENERLKQRLGRLLSGAVAEGWRKAFKMAQSGEIAEEISVECDFLLDDARMIVEVVGQLAQAREDKAFYKDLCRKARMACSFDQSPKMDGSEQRRAMEAVRIVRDMMKPSVTATDEAERYAIDAARGGG